MAKRLTHALTYDAPLTDVSAMLDDVDFRHEVCTYQRVLRSTVDVEDSPHGFQVVIDRVQRAQGIPPVAQKFVGDEIRIIQTETWTSDTEAVLHVTIPGKPAEVTGTITLSESGGKTIESIDAQVKVQIPLVAGKIETLIVDLLRKALEAEAKVGADYLSR